MLNPRVRPMGERAFLLEVGTLDEVLPLHAELAATRPEGVVDLVPAARTVLVRVDTRRLPLAAGRAWALGAAEAAEPEGGDAGALVELDIVYDGADLAATADLIGIGTEELVRRHAAAEWRVAFTGFAPGFGYLVSEDWPFDVPRLDSPRTRVPAGAVGLAGGFSGAYPRETPGGWRLIGTTAERLFDPDAASPALLAPGTRVRFRPVTAAQPVSPTRSDDVAGGRAPVPYSPVPATVPDLESGTGRARGIRIVEPGLLATLQDLGREGSASVGVAVSGALDRGALRTANRLLGNPEAAAAIEVTMGGLRAVAEDDLWVAVTGGWGAVRIDGRDADPYAAHVWPAGAELQLDWFAHGARAYVAVRGGLDGRLALG